MTPSSHIEAQSPVLSVLGDSPWPCGAEFSRKAFTLPFLPGAFRRLCSVCVFHTEEHSLCESPPPKKAFKSQTPRAARGEESSTMAPLLEGEITRRKPNRSPIGLPFLSRGCFLA